MRQSVKVAEAKHVPSAGAAQRSASWLDNFSPWQQSRLMACAKDLDEVLARHGCEAIVGTKPNGHPTLRVVPIERAGEFKWRA